MIENERARALMLSADLQARRLGEKTLGTEHLLLAISLYDNPSDARDDALFWATYHLGLDPQRVQEKISRRSPRAPISPSTAALPLSPNLRLVLQLAGEEARSMGYLDDIMGEHLLLGITRNASCTAFGILAAIGISPASARETIFYLLERMDKIPERILARHEY